MLQHHALVIKGVEPHGLGPILPMGLGLRIRLLCYRSYCAQALHSVSRAHCDWEMELGVVRISRGARRGPIEVKQHGAGSLTIVLDVVPLDVVVEDIVLQRKLM
jgi:hypothetical protein